MKPTCQCQRSARSVRAAGVPTKRDHTVLRLPQLPDEPGQKLLRMCAAPLLAVTLNLAAAPLAEATPVKVVETSLGFGENVRVLRHLGLRFYENEDQTGDFYEAHFGPGEGGSMRLGFLKMGKGKVADAEYLGVYEAGDTKLTPQEAMDWCDKWADGKVYVTVGQNCWTMVHDFLLEHDGTFVNDSVKFKEETVNQATQTLVYVIEDVAQKEGREPYEVMNELMSEPSRVLPLLFTAENMKEYLPENMQNVVNRGLEIKDEIEQDVGDFEKNVSVGQVQERVQGIREGLEGRAQEADEANKAK